MGKTFDYSKQARGVGDIGEGDYIKIGSQWKEVAHNTAEGDNGFLPKAKSWTVTTKDGGQYGMYSIRRYAKAEDMIDK